jgi:hypothetical protein
MPVRYENDVVLWAEEQAANLRAGRFDALDIEHLADEILDVGKSEKRELASRMAVLLAHWLKWQHQPERRGASWDRTLSEQRLRIGLLLDETPSLRRSLVDPAWKRGTWADAVTDAIKETGLDSFPETCPWELTDVLRPDWRPE